MKENESLKERIKQMSVGNEQKLYELTSKVKLEEEKNNMLMNRADAQHENALRAQEELRRDATEAVSKLRRKYESKLSKLQRQLVERETYEQKLKGLLENEVGNVSRWQKELDRVHELQSAAGDLGKFGREKLKMLEMGHHQKALNDDAAYTSEGRKELAMTRLLERNMDSDLGLERFSKHKKDGRSRAQSAERYTHRTAHRRDDMAGTVCSKIGKENLLKFGDANQEVAPGWLREVERRIEENVLKSLGR